MLFKTLVSASLAASIIASPLHHHHEHKLEKKDVVTKTKFVYVTGASKTSSLLSAQHTPAATSTSVSSKSDTAQIQLSTSSNPTTSETKTASSDNSDSSSNASSGNFGAGAKGITYSPYSDDGGCKSSSQIKQEIQQLSDFEVIRVYATDCNQLSDVLAYKTSSQKVFAGIYDVSNIESTCKEIASAVKANGGWGNIHTISVGNELVNSGQANPSQIKNYVETAKSALKSEGYNGPVVSVDTFIAVINNPELCKYSDYMAVNAHAYFDGHAAAELAGDWVLEQIQRVHTACDGASKVLITETGWPSRGNANGVAVPSKQNQETAVKSIKLKCGDDTLLFTAFNDLWKADGAYNVEKYWGILSN